MPMLGSIPRILPMLPMIFSVPKPYNLIWQGAIVFYNNIWKVPGPIRVIAAVFL